MIRISVITKLNALLALLVLAMLGLGALAWHALAQAQERAAAALQAVGQQAGGAGVAALVHEQTLRLATDHSAGATWALQMMALLELVAAGLAVVLRLSIRTGILRSIRAAGQVVARVAEGDLTARVGVSAHGETQKMLQGLDRMTIDLQELVGQVVVSAQAVADASAQIAQGNRDLSQRTEEQASTLEETASSMEELT